jgi:hypothetical protein
MRIGRRAFAPYRKSGTFDGDTRAAQALGGTIASITRAIVPLLVTLRCV